MRTMAKRMLALAVMGIMCVSAAAAQEVELDAAIQQAVKDLTGIPAFPGIKIALVNFQTPSKELSDYVLTEIAQGIAKTNKLPQSTRVDTDKALGVPSSNAVSDQVVIQTGKQLKVSYAFTGSLEKLGNSYRFRTKVLNVQTGAMQMTKDVNIKSSALLIQLLGETPAPTPPPGPRPAPKTEAPVPAPVATPASVSIDDSIYLPRVANDH